MDLIGLQSRAMPVVTCPDCGREVSTMAAACPHCGRPSSPATYAAPTVAIPPIAEETLWRGSPSARVLVGKIVAIILTAILIPAAAAFIAKQTNDIEMAGRITKFGWLIAAIAVFWQIVTFLIVMLRLQSTTYTITNQRVMIERGMLSKSLNEIDLRYIDDTQFFQSFSGRLLGIGNVTLISSDKAFPTTVLQGIAKPRDIREMIRARAYQVSQRQLFTRAT
jgi:membrane protein YdbS with pleckstrin-like domain